MQNPVNKVKEHIDWSIVVSTILATLLIGFALYALPKLGLRKVANIAAKGV